MEPEKLTNYERQRLENIRRNDEMLVSLKIRSKANELLARVAETKRQSFRGRGCPRGSKTVKFKPKAPIIIGQRQSLRVRGEDPPDYSVVKGVDTKRCAREMQFVESLINPTPSELGSLSMRDAYRGTASDQTLIETIRGVPAKSQLTSLDEASSDLQMDDSVGIYGENEAQGNAVVGSLDLGSLTLKPENIARVMMDRVMTLKFFPSTDVNMIVAGNNLGNVAFWNIDFEREREEGDGIYLYRPHAGYVTGISIQPFSPSKIFSSSYDGVIRLMDAKKEAFYPIYCSVETIYSLNQQPNDINCLYFSKGPGGFNIIDERAGKSSTSIILHKDRINSIEFNKKNPNIFATSSSDGTACIWDLRSIDAYKPKTLRVVNCNRSVHSAYFSPSGSCLAISCQDNKVRILRGINLEDVSTTHYHERISPYFFRRAIWGWDDSHVLVGTKKKSIDVICPTRGKRITTLQSEYMTSNPWSLAAHPYKVGMLAGGTTGGNLFVWVPSVG